MQAERRWVPLSSVGIYVPGGRAAYPSSLVMAAVPAQVAGVERIAVVTPRPAEATLATAHALGIDEVYAVGGAQAIAALAYGTETIERVDKIVGPGNAYVTAAKLLVSSHVAIDLPAGPSEVVVIADATADAAPVRRRPARPGRARPRQPRAPAQPRARAHRGRRASSSPGTRTWPSRTSTSLDEALARSDDFAPEHLELWVEDAEDAAARVRNAGSVFVRTSAVVGDYAAGATHVLPTRGLARGAGGLGLESLPQADPVRAREPRRARASARDRRCRSRASRACRCTRPRWSRDERAAAAGRTFAPTPGRPARPRSLRGTGCARSRSSASTRTRRRCPASRRCRSRRASRG